MGIGKIYSVIGLMSGTSLDGVDAALIRTDGQGFVDPQAFISLPYAEETRAAVRACFGRRDDADGAVARAEALVTRAHAAAVDWLLSKTGKAPRQIDLIGFHGQTICHDPARRFTWQIGNGPMLARLTGIDVINDFRSADVAAGGEGAPLIPLYHQARASASDLERPLAVLNIGGVANVTYLGVDGAVIAFDTGPGNALVDDWVLKTTGQPYDEDGKLAAQGRVDESRLEQWLADIYFARKAPKSLDRDMWTAALAHGLSPADGAATLSAFTYQTIRAALAHLPQTPRRWLVTGGGRHNQSFMRGLRTSLNAPVDPVEAVGWNGDALEAEGFGYLAVRALLGLPVSLPGTTGVPKPLSGGRLNKVAV